MIVFQPYGRRIEASVGETLLEAAGNAGVNISSICGGEGLCGKCRVIVRDGKQNLSSPTEMEKRALSREDLTNGFRLACQARVKKKGKIVIEVPPESQIDRQRLLLRGLERRIELRPAVRKINVRLREPSLTDIVADVDRLLEAVESETGLKVKVDYDVIRKTPHVLRREEWSISVTLWRDEEIISVEPGFSQDMYGFAVDIGTTKLAGYLVDLSNGTIMAATSMMNPQIAYGEDVITRIKFAMEDEENLKILSRSVIKGINKLISEACRKAQISRRRIYDMTVAGNTAMHHIFLGIPPNYVALIPYPAALQSAVDVKARELGVKINPGAYVHALPTVAGFVGGDAVADILATEIYRADEVSMLIDIGTNTEIALGNNEKLVACSCASGPAFEGAHIKHGMRALSGAIERVWIDPETFEVGYKTIEDEKPRGLCGSGIIDAVAEMLKTGLIDSSGRFNMEIDTPRLRRNENSVEFVIAWRDETLNAYDIVVTQNDIREIQLAKAAIYTGASILMKHRKIQPGDIQKVYLAGAFGNYVDPQNAKIIGMYPDVPLERVEFVGNTAGSGARIVLLSVDARRTAEEMAKKIEYVELGADLNFQNEFLKATYLPHREPDRFPNVMTMLRKSRGNP